MIAPFDRIRFRCTAVAMLAGVALATAASAAVVHVPGDQPTIQAGIDAAATGDTVLVAPGTYTGAGNRNIDFGGKDVVLIGAEGPEATIIDCQQQGRGFHFHSFETSAAAVEGLTITNGLTPSAGGGAYCEQSTPTFRRCNFSHNTAHSGGAIVCGSSASLRIEDCRFVENSAVFDSVGGEGGAITSLLAQPEITGSEFIGNRAALGGAVYSRFHDGPDITSCSFSDNRCVFGGGAMYFEASDVHVADCVFTYNYSDWKGGAVYWEGRPAGGLSIFERCSFISNTAHTEGGAMAAFECGLSLEVDSCAFITNTAPRGGAVAGGAPFTSCTFYANASPSGSAAYYSDDLQVPSFERCILAFGVQSSPLAKSCSQCAGLACCDLFGNQGGDYVGCWEELLGVDGNISEDPLFCDPPAGDLAIDAASPCAPEHSPAGCGLIGALDVGCDVAAIASESSGVSTAPRLVISPNPVARSATFTWGPAHGPATIAIYDVGGRLVARLDPSKGDHALWELPPDLPSGVYFAEISTNGAGGATSVAKFMVSH